MKRKYWIHIYQDPEEPGVWIGEVPGVRGVISDGDSKEEAIANTLEALEGMLPAMKKRGLPIPQPDDEWVEVEVNAA